MSPVLLVRPLLAAHYLRACGRDEGPPRAVPLCPGASRRRCAGGGAGAGAGGTLCPASGDFPLGGRAAPEERRPPCVA